MTPQEYKSVKKILAQLLLVPQEEQQMLIEKLCASEPELEEKVKQLLRLNTSKYDLLMAAPAIKNQLTDSIETTITQDIPKSIKGYQIIECIGSGGMGHVYLAVQSYPAERHVAIKVLKNSPDQNRLFDETQILAKLNHPNIAMLYEVDKTECGQLFIVMELIEGENIITWCKQHGYDLIERLNLFLQLCSGISYSHEKGVIHCDIKPVNVRVTLIDGRPVVKIIDFGISQFQLKNKKMHKIAGTPAYLAPEVLLQKDKGLTNTRRDIYALGVLLKDLLMNPVHPDLKAIIDKASNPDQQLRYDSASQLSDDIRRFLDKRPVNARTGTISYVVKRFIERNLIFVTFSVALVISLIGGFVAQSLQANEALRQANIANKQKQAAELAQSEAEELTTFLIDLFQLANPERDDQDVVSANQLIDHASDKLLKIKSPTISDARFMHTLGSIYTRMDQLDKAQIIIGESLEIKQLLLPENDDEIISGFIQLGLINRKSNNDNLAEKYLVKSIDLYQSNKNPDISQLAFAHNHLGNLYWQNDRISESIEHHEKALSLRTKLGDNKLKADSLNNLGAIYKRDKQWDLSQSYLNQALALYRSEYDENHPYIAFVLNNMANVEENRFNWHTAEKLYKSTFEKLNSIYGEDHQNTLTAQMNLAIFLTRRMRFDESIDLRKRVIDIYRSKGNTDQVAKQLNRLANNYFHLGDHMSAMYYYAEAIDYLSKNKTKDQYLEAKLAIDHADLLIQNNSLQSALAILKKALKDLYSHPNPKYFYIQIALNLLAKINYIQSKHAEAIEYHQKVLELNDQESKANQNAIIEAEIGLANNKAKLNMYIEAQSHLRSALITAINNFGTTHKSVAKIYYEQGQLAVRRGNLENAKSLFEKALKQQQIALPVSHPDIKNTQIALSLL